MTWRVGGVELPACLRSEPRPGQVNHGSKGQEPDHVVSGPSVLGVQRTETAYCFPA